MSVSVGFRSLFGFAVGVAVAVIAVFVFQALSADAAPGDTDATLVPITPCRLIDTRPGVDRVGPHSGFGAGDTKVIVAHGANGQCTIPSDAVGLSLNVTAVGSTAPSFLTIWPAGDLPKASSLNPAPGQPPIPNAVTTTLSDTGSFKVFNKAGGVDVIVDVNGYYTKASLQELTSRIVALEAGTGTDLSVLARITALEAENAELKELTASMSLETVDGHNTVRFSGVNLQVVDGSGNTQCNDVANNFETCNGRGNLIIGYHEDVGATDEIRSGSHNIVTGIDNDYESHSGIIAGRGNTVSGEYASVTGGLSNVASGPGSSVSGGQSNTASGTRASVSGGMSNTASGSRASVSGGRSSTAGGSYSSVSGGLTNTASGETSSVSGGDTNFADGDSAVVVGGTGNQAAGPTTVVTGGDANFAMGDFAVVVGGFQNQASGPRAVVTGGGQNIASGSKAVVSGGDQVESGNTFDWRAGSLFQDD